MATDLMSILFNSITRINSNDIYTAGLNASDNPNTQLYYTGKNYYDEGPTVTDIDRFEYIDNRSYIKFEYRSKISPLNACHITAYIMSNGNMYVKHNTNEVNELLINEDGKMVTSQFHATYDPIYRSNVRSCGAGHKYFAIVYKDLTYELMYLDSDNVKHTITGTYRSIFWNTEHILIIDYMVYGYYDKTGIFLTNPISIEAFLGSSMLSNGMGKNTVFEYASYGNDVVQYPNYNFNHFISYYYTMAIFFIGTDGKIYEKGASSPIQFSNNGGYKTILAAIGGVVFATKDNYNSNGTVYLISGIRVRHDNTVHPYENNLINQFFTVTNNRIIYEGVFNFYIVSSHKCTLILKNKTDNKYYVWVGPSQHVLTKIKYITLSDVNIGDRFTSNTGTSPREFYINVRTLTNNQPFYDVENDTYIEGNVVNYV